MSKYRESDFFMALAKYLKGLPLEDLDSLLSGEYQLKFELSGKKQNVGKKRLANEADIKEVLQHLQNSNSREQAKTLLMPYLKRSNLELICKQLDLPYSKRDNLQDLEKKIIENTVGYRLRSQAIRGKNEDI